MLGLKSNSHRPSPEEFVAPIMALANSFPRSIVVERGEGGIVAGADSDRYVFSMLAEQVRSAQVFEFGTIPDDRIRSESKRGGDLYNHNLLRLPFTSVIYWYTFKGDPETYKSMGLPSDIPDLRYATVAMDGSRIGLQSKRGKLLVLADFVEGMEGVTIRDHRYRTQMYLSCAGVVDLGGDFYEGRIVTDLKTTDSAEKSYKAGMHIQAAALGGLTDGAVALTMMLATKGIPLRRELPSAKLNAKRARNGKSPLTTVTYVDTNRYFEALYNTEHIGSHSSPVPHLRRGHIRHFNDGTSTWIRDCLVNCRSLDEVKRDHYAVKVNS